MKLHGPDHPISIAPYAGTVRVTFAGRVVAETTRALALDETTLPRVFYVPREDVDFALFRRSATVTHCPYKGDAAHFDLVVGDRVAPNASWSYEQPYPAMAPIAGYVAFYPKRVDAIEMELG